MAAASRPAGGRSFLTLLSVMVLIGVEVFGVALAGGWALAGLLEIGETLGYALMGAFALLGLYVMMLLWRRATAVESPRR